MGNGIIAESNSEESIDARMQRLRFHCDRDGE